MFNNSDGTFMDVHLEQIGPSRYSIAHYFEQNGDLVPDPDLVVWRAGPGDYVPVSLQLAIGVRDCCMEFGSDGQPNRFSPKLQNKIGTFANEILKNIRDQQGGLEGLKNSQTV